MKRSLHKVLDEVSEIRCASGPGLIREETWHDEQGEVARYNLTFINHFMSAKDDGRVLGYDNSHGYHYRHYRGAVEHFEFKGYAAIFERFVAEVEQLRKEKA